MKQRTFWILFLGGVIAVIGGSYFIAETGTFGGPGSQAKASCTEYGAQFIKYPADAEWQVESVEEIGGNSWRVRGNVLAPNAFGVRDRLDFDCGVRIYSVGESGIIDRFVLDGESLDIRSRLERIIEYE